MVFLGQYYLDRIEECFPTLIHAMPDDLLGVVMEAKANGKASKSGEISMTLTENNNKPSPADAGTEVVISISGDVSKASNISVDSAQNLSASEVPMSCCPSPEIAGFSSSSPNKPRKIPTAQTLARRKSLSRSVSVLSKPKSRFGEQSVPLDSILAEEIMNSSVHERTEQNPFLLNSNLSYQSSPINKMATPRTPLMASPGGRKNVLYFVHGLKKSVQVCIWLGLVLLTWVLLFNHGAERSPKTTRILDRVTWTIASLLIGSFLWLLKTTLLKILASSFHLNRFFDRIQESILHQYILQTLSGLPVMESAQMIRRASSTSHLSFQLKQKGKEGKKKEVIDINKLYRMKQEKVSAWTMKVLVDVISSSGLSTISNAIDEDFYDGRDEQMDKEITNEMEAIAAAYHIFYNVAHTDGMYIYEEDLSRFMIKEEVDLVFSLVEPLETRLIDKKAFMEWVVKVYKGRKTLSHALNDTKSAVKQLNKLITGILLVVMIIVWLLLVEIATTKILFFLSSQLVVAAFVFGNTCKTIFEALIFVFVMHPYDVGDRCVIDGVQMIVEEMNILTTVFLRYDAEKIYYPNSVLATKPISNFYRSPNMGDSLEFCVDFTTPVEKIGALKGKIKNYLVNNSQHWHPNHSVVMKEIEDVNKIKMVLYFNHTMNFQEYIEKLRRRSELAIEMKRIFEELGIKYNLLPPGSSSYSI
ncbi:unnamed protein product [Camellia sinensis]